MTTVDVAKRYVELVEQQKYDECLDELFTDDAVSVEAAGPPGQDRTARGMEAIREKGKWWADNHIVHSTAVSGPYPHGDRFAVYFQFDLTFKPENRRFSMSEVGVFTVEDGKIVKEELFYST